MDEELVAFWRSKYKEVYSATLGDTEFWFRALTVAEIDAITTANQSSVDIEDLYIHTAVLYPLNVDLDDFKAGHITQLVNQIMDVSGVSDISFILSTLLERRTTIQTDVVAMMKVFIIGAMPMYKEEDLDALTVKQLTERVVLAEQIHTLHQNVSGIPSDGVEFQITLEGAQQEEAPVPQKKKKAPAPTPQEKVDRETLLKRIRSDEKGMTDVNKIPVNTSSQFENFDEEVLLKAAGVLKPNDPIAAKLHQAFGG